MAAFQDSEVELDDFTDEDQKKIIPLLPEDEGDDILLRAARATPFIATLEEQNELFRRYFKEGDKAAYNRILVTHVRFAFSRARAHLNYGVPEEILKGVAIESLMECLERFDPSSGNRFTTFSGKSIDGDLKSFIGDYHGLPRTAYIRNIFLTLRGVKYTLDQEHPGIASHDMDKLILAYYNKKLGHHTEIKQRHIDFVEDKIASMYLSLNNKVGQDQDASEKIDFIASPENTPEEHLERRENSAFSRAFLNAAMLDMTQQKREIVEYMYFGDEEVSIKDTAAHFKLPYHIAGQIHGEILESFKAAAAKLDRGTFEYKKFETIPTTDHFHLPTPADEEAYETAKAVLSAKDFYLFSSIHLHERWETIALSDLAEALDITPDAARKRLATVTRRVIEEMSPGFADANFLERIDENLKKYKGRNINDFPFAESQVELPTSEHKEIYKKAWNTLEPTDLYIFLAYRMYAPHLRKNIFDLEKELNVSYQTVFKSLQKSTETLRQNVRKSLQKHSVFSDRPDKSVRTSGTRKSKEDIPPIDMGMIDLSTEDQRVVYETAVKNLTPYRLYAICMNCLVKPEYRQLVSEISETLKQNQNTTHATIGKAKAAVREALPAHLKDTDILDQGPQRGGKKIANSLQTPELDVTLIDHDIKETKVIFETAKRILSPYQLYVFTAYRLYKETERIDYDRMAALFIESNPDDKSLSQANMRTRISVTLGRATQSVKDALPHEIKECPVMHASPPHAKKIAYQMRQYPQVNEIAREKTPDAKRIYEYACRVLNPLELYAYSMFRLARNTRLKTVDEIAHDVNRDRRVVLTSLKAAMTKLQDILPDDIKNHELVSFDYAAAPLKVWKKSLAPSP